MDKERCVDEGSLGAHCAHAYSSGTRDLDKDTWDNTRFGWFCESPEDTVEDKKESEELCSIKGVTCTVQAKQMIQAHLHKQFQLARRLKAHAMTVQ